MPIPEKVQTFHNDMSAFPKEARRHHAIKIANAFTQRHPLGTDDFDELTLLRHTFVYLQTEDIANYIGHLNVQMSWGKSGKLWRGDPPLWASTCRMMHTYYRSDAWEYIWRTSLDKAQTTNAQVFAGLYSAAYEKRYTDTWAKTIENTDSAWIKPYAFEGWNTVPEATKLKIWMVVSSKKDYALLQTFAMAMGWETQWSLAESLLGEHLFHSDFDLRETAIKQLLVKPKTTETYALPPLDLVS